MSLTQGLRLLIGVLLAIGLALMSATGFGYSSAVSPVLAFCLSLIFFLVPYLSRFSGRTSRKLLIFSLCVSIALSVGMVIHFAAFGLGGGDFAEALRRVISDEGVLQPIMISTAMIFVGSFLIGLVLPNRKG